MEPPARNGQHPWPRYIVPGHAGPINETSNHAPSVALSDKPPVQPLQESPLRGTARPDRIDIARTWAVIGGGGPLGVTLIGGFFLLVRAQSRPFAPDPAATPRPNTPTPSATGTHRGSGKNGTGVNIAVVSPAPPAGRYASGFVLQTLHETREARQRRRVGGTIIHPFVRGGGIIGAVQVGHVPAMVWSLPPKIVAQ